MSVIYMENELKIAQYYDSEIPSEMLSLNVFIYLLFLVAMDKLKKE